MTNAEEKALAYIKREARRESTGWQGRELEPLGGLKLGAFRAARSSLERQGLVKQVNGRWVLVETTSSA